LPHDTDISRLEIEPPTPFAAFLLRYQWWFKAAFLLGLALLFYAVLRWRENRRRRLIAEPESRTRPPYVWNIVIEGLPPPAMNEDWQTALNRLRRRTAEEHYYLDLPATVRATIARGGFADFRYAQHTRPPEYLMLIDRQGAANHRAQLFDELYRSFRDNEVLVERFFFEGDVRLCWNEAHPDGVGLSELQQRYPASRLLVVSNGFALLSPLTGKLAKWSGVFTRWKERSLLSPVPSGAWGRREERLRGLFTVLPASLQSLSFLIEQFDAGEDADFSDWREKITDAPVRPIAMEGGLIDTLRRFFGEETLQWIAACAVYPTLHYDLTRYLGSLLSTAERPLASFGGLAELARLPWFAEGRIPQAARAALLDYLERGHPGLLLRIREALHGLLQKNSPPPDSAAWEEHRMAMALNEWLFTKDARRKKELEREIAALLEQGVEADFTVVKYLDRERSPLDFVVPDAWKKYLYKGGRKGLGLRGLWKDALYRAAPLWLAFAALAVWHRPSLPQCHGEPKEYRERTLCLDKEEDYLLYYEFLGRDAIREGHLPTLDSLNEQARPYAREGLRPPLDSVVQVYRQNIAASLYNEGAPLYRRAADSLRMGAAAGYEATKAEACMFFEATINYDTTDFNIRRALAWCRELPAPELVLPDSLGGLVRDAATGQPLPEVQVSGGGFDLRTDARGAYVLLLKAAGYDQPALRLTFGLEGYLSAAITVALESAQEIPVVELRPGPTYTVAGTVRDTAGRPLTAVAVTIAGLTASSDASGGYTQRLPSTQQGLPLRLRFEKDGYLPLDTLLTPGSTGQLPEVRLKQPRPDQPVAPTDPVPTSDTPIPAMVRVQGGTFEMGDIFDEGFIWERSVHTVTVSDFHIGRYEVTFEEYDAFCDATGREKPGDEDWGRSRRPVINVSWNDAVEYCNWLSGRHGYRAVYTIDGIT
jgi:hypothetical protein